MIRYPKSAAFALTAGLLFASAGYAGGVTDPGPPDNADNAPESGAADTAPPAQELKVPTQPAEFDDATLNRFADAYLDLQAIRVDYTGRLQTVEDEAKAKQIQQEASEKMLVALQENELKVEQYNQIAMALQTDPQLREKVAQIVSEMEKQ